MPLYRPDGPRPIVDKTNTTVMDLTEHLVAISKRAQSVDETLAPAEYVALHTLVRKMYKALQDFDDSVDFEAKRNKPKRKNRTYTMVVRQRSRPEQQ